MANINIDTKIQDKNQEESLKEIEEMYRAGIHFGYSGSLSHPKMRPYFFGTRSNVQIFNLEKIYPMLKEAMKFLKDLGSVGAKFLLVSTKPEAKDIIEKAGREVGMPYVTERWLGGTLTNFDMLKKQIDSLKEFQSKKVSGDFSNYTKKEIVRMEKRMSKMEKYFGGLQSLAEIPAALLIVDTKEEKAAVKEARKVGVPIVAVLNSDCDPSLAAYPVPANDVAPSSIRYLLDKMVKAYKNGNKNK